MDDEMEQRIKHRARELWEIAGLEEGREEEFRLKAEEQVRGESETYEKIRNDPRITTNS